MRLKIKNVFFKAILPTLAVILGLNPNFAIAMDLPEIDRNMCTTLVLKNADPKDLPSFALVSKQWYKIANHECKDRTYSEFEPIVGKRCKIILPYTLPPSWIGLFMDVTKPSQAQKTVRRQFIFLDDLKGLQFNALETSFERKN